MASCTYSPPSGNVDPNNYVSTIGSGFPFKGYFTWSQTYCSSTDPDSHFSTSSPNCHPTLKSNLDLWINSLNYFSTTYGAYPAIAWVGHGGAYVSNRTEPSYHRTGQAIDIWLVKWGTNTRALPCNSPHDTSDTLRHRRYLAVEASLRKYFGYVLDYKIPDHHNHFHVDNGCPTAMNILTGSTSRPYKSTAYFIQDVCRKFNGSTITHDGLWGPQTDAAFSALLTKLGMQCLSPKTNLSHYRLFLDYVQMHGYKNVAAGYYRYGGCGPV